MLTIEQIKKAAEQAAKEFPIKSISLFGSYANGTNTEASDVDLLVEFTTKAVSLMTICGLKIRMEELLNIEVDVVKIPIPETSIIEIERVVPLYAA